MAVGESPSPPAGGGRARADGGTVVADGAAGCGGGTSDVLSGLAAAAAAATSGGRRQTRLVNGSTPGALEAFLALRGVRTLPLRMERMQANAVEVVARLRTHTAVADVRYPGFGAMVAFVLAGCAEAAEAACRAVRLIVPATSLGGVESSMERRQKYAGDAHVPPGLIRMSVGIEHVDDIWADLAQALAAG